MIRTGSDEDADAATDVFGAEIVTGVSLFTCPFGCLFEVLVVAGVAVVIGIE